MDRNWTGEGKAKPDPHVFTRVSIEFQSIVKGGLEGIYDARDGAFPSNGSSNATRRLRAVVHTEKEKFAEFMRVHGQQRRVVSNTKGGESTGKSSSHSTSGLTGNSSNAAAQPDEKAQGEELLVTTKQMLAWVKQVRSQIRVQHVMTDLRRCILKRGAENCQETTTIPCCKDCFTPSLLCGVKFLNPT